MSWFDHPAHPMNMDEGVPAPSAKVKCNREEMLSLAQLFKLATENETEEGTRLSFAERHRDYERTANHMAEYNQKFKTIDYNPCYGD